MSRDWEQVARAAGQGDPTACLHCIVLGIMNARGNYESVNEQLFKLMEVMAVAIAGCADRNGRRQLIADMRQRLPGMVAHHVRRRAEDGVPPHRDIKSGRDG